MKLLGERQQVMPVAVLCFLHWLHCAETCELVRGILGYKSDVLRIDREWRLFRCEEQLGTIVANQLVGSISEHPRKVFIVWILDWLGEFNPQIATARLCSRVFLVSFVRR